MTQRNWLAVGVKLLGVYFAVLGITGLVIVGCNIAFELALRFRESASDMRSVRIGGLTLIDVLQPLAYLLCAFALTNRTERLLKFIDFSKGDA